MLTGTGLHESFSLKALDHVTLSRVISYGTRQLYRNLFMYNNVLSFKRYWVSSVTEL